MKEVTIKGRVFTEKEVVKYGKKSIKKTRNILLVIGMVFLAITVFFWFISLTAWGICAASGEPIYSEEMGEEMTILDILLVDIVVTAVYGTPGIVLLLLSFVKSKENPYTAGIIYIKKHFPYPVGFDGLVATPLIGDKTILLCKAPYTTLTISAEDKNFQIVKDKKYTRIFSYKDILDYEIKVDNEVVVTSKTNNTKGFGKALVGGVLFGGAGMIAGAIAGNSKASTNQSQKEVHHYSLLIKLNDILTPAFVVNLPSLQKAEEVATTLAIICHTETSSEPQNEVIEQPKSTAEPASDSKPENKVDKFEEIKKYKELLDMGIITQEEFDSEKKKLFG